MKKLKKLGLVILVAMLLVTFAGCDKEVTTKYTVEEIGQGVLEKMELDDIIQLDDEKFEYFYNTPVDDVEAYYAVVIKDNVKVDAVVIIQAKEGKADSVKEGLKKHLASQKESFKDYLPEEYERLEGAKLVQQGNYIMFCVGNNIKDAVKEFNQSFE